MVMRENSHIALMGERVILVPYTASMVDTYHAWMVCLTAWQFPPLLTAYIGP